MVKSGHLADNVDEGIPRLLDAAGLDCVEIATQQHRVLGRVTYYRATRPA